MTSAVVFDVDGTLVTFRFDVLGARKALIEEMSRRGFDARGLGLATSTQEIMDSARAQVESGEVKGEFKEVRDAAFSILDTFELQGAVHSSPFPQTRQTLDLLRTRGMRLAALTNSGRKASTEVLSRGGLADCFEFVLTRDDTITLKPRPDGLAAAVTRLGVPKEAACYIGDSPIDIKAARLAGLRVVCVATGNYSSERLKAEGADAVVASIGEVPRALDF